MAENLRFLAGEKALSIIRDEGLKPERVRVVAGAAGGPKPLIFNPLDQLLFGHWLRERTAPLFLLGASIGAWRFAAACRNNPAYFLGQLAEAYKEQSYRVKPGPQMVSREGARILARFLEPGAGDEILSHPSFRLCVMAVRSQGLANTRKQNRLGLALAGAALANAVHRRFLGGFFQRALFYDPRNRPPFYAIADLPIQRLPLTPENLKPALMASGSIPWVMAGVEGIPGAPAGVYRDGGVIDYHFDIPFTDQGLVLYPHFIPRLIPGWLDKRLFWRQASAAHTARVVLICPSREFIQSLPHGKIPDRSDFVTFFQRDGARKQYWQKAIEAGRRLRDEFWDAVESGRIQKRVRRL